MPRWIKGEGWLDRECAHCQQPFRVKRNQLARTPSIYCSPACANRARAGESGAAFASREELTRLYIDEGMTLRAIGDRYGVTLQAVAYHLESAGVPRREWNGAHVVLSPEARAKSKANHTRGAAHHSFRNIPDAEIIALYADGLSTTAIAAKFGVTPMTINRHLRANGVERRQPGFSRWRTAQDGHLVQSGWELLVDDWLSAHGVEHECQPTLPFGDQLRADFLVGETYIEVWGVVHNRKYADRKSAKLAQYTEYGISLIEIYPRHIERENFAPLHVLL